MNNLIAKKQNQVASKLKELTAPYPWARCQMPNLKEQDYKVVHLTMTGQLFGQKKCGQG